MALNAKNQSWTQLRVGLTAIFALAMLGVLKAGGSDYPYDILKRAGLDMASPAPYRAVVAQFKDTLDQVEALIG